MIQIWGNDMKKILVIYASAGDGHKKAAEAIYKSLLYYKADVLVMPIDSLNYTTRFFKFFYKRTYIIMIKKFPWLWGFFYRLLNIRFFFVLASLFRMIANIANSKRLAKFLRAENFDVIVSTHFFAPYIISRLKKKGLIKSRLINVITDFMPHLYWISDCVDIYTVAANETALGLENMGVTREKIMPLGIPVRKQFLTVTLKQQARARLGLDSGRFTILMMRGGLGVGPVIQILKRLRALTFNLQVIVVCGHNTALRSQVSAVDMGPGKNIQVTGFSHDVAQLMAASDIMVSKAGGITVAEALSIGLPIICFNPIPGQEQANALFLTENNIGFKAKTLNDINAIIENVRHNPASCNELEKRIRQAGKPSAAIDIAGLALGMLKR
ncbi:MAG: glycosyltransferase [Candidatus Omnitrophica bacterium]|nr:glycosyltransferase [Candidatus Omnitrophota bacterium]